MTRPLRPLPHAPAALPGSWFLIILFFIFTSQDVLTDAHEEYDSVTNDYEIAETELLKERSLLLKMQPSPSAILGCSGAADIVFSLANTTH